MNDKNTPAVAAIAILSDGDYAEGFAKKRLRQKLGQEGLRVKGTELLIREMDHDFGTPAHACLLLDSENDTFTSFNCYGEKGDVHIGRNFDAEGMTYPLSAKGDAKRKEWRKKGYRLIADHAKDDSTQFGFSSAADIDVCIVSNPEASVDEEAKPKTDKAKTPAKTPETADSAS